MLFVVNTLEYLHRSGRIGGGKRIMGTALQIKPLLHFQDGLIQSIGQARTMKKALLQLLDLVEERLAGRAMAEVAVVNIDCVQEGQMLIQAVEERFAPRSIHLAEVSPVVGMIVGPGAIGIAFYPVD
jgi:DegV family protein with EDD domain